jgi:hypothetical protein
MEKKIVVIITYKPFYFFTKICAASVRYYYPDAEIYIVKDNLEGEFDTSELEQALNVKQLDLGKKNYGWSAAKVHLLASDKFAGQRIFSLDCDIVLAGRFLDELYEQTKGYDFVLDSDYREPVGKEFEGHYYNYDRIRKELDPNFVYPGYAFNGGQAIITTGKIPRELLFPFFDVDTFPYYKRRDILPQADQSLLNYLLPTLQRQGKLKIAPAPLMWWSNGAEVKEASLEKIKAGDAYKRVIHWAGVLRVPYLDKMTRPDILHFFQDYYYSQVPFGAVKKQAHKLLAFSDFYLRNAYRATLKPIILPLLNRK